MPKKPVDDGDPPIKAARKPRKKADAADSGDAPAKAAPKKRRSSGKPAVTAKVKARPVSWRSFLVREALTWGGGAVAGVGIAGALLWAQARRDVTAWLAEPPHAAPGVIWSAPIEIRPGQRASLPSIAGDLLAAGYDRVEQVKEGGASGGAGQFAIQGGVVQVWTAPLDAPGVHVRGGSGWLRLEQGVVAQTEPAAGLVLRPTVLGTIGDLDERRADAKLAQMGPWVEPALLAIEDARFREHHGVDPIGIARALARNLLGGSGMQGGSTLTQQLAKNLFLSADRTIQRKVREAFFAAALEAELSKDALLELYLSEIYLGQMGGLPLHGVEAAARAWFGVSAANLELHEAATVVGVIAAPNRWSPVRHPEECLTRRNTVLDRMVATGAISEAQAEKAKEQPLQLAGIEPSRVRRAPYAVDLAVDRAEEVLGEGALARGGFQVHTTIQPLLQRAAEEAVAAGMGELDTTYPKAAGAQVALVALRVSDGAVVAMVGGRSYATSPFNRTTQAWRQAGSTVKPLTLLAALDDGTRTPADPILDAPISRVIDGKPWTPTNYDGTYLGEITIRKAIETSRNIPAILLAEEVGMSRLQRLYREAGLSRATHYPSAALGAFPATPMEMASAYTAFPGGGTVRRPILVESIATATGEAVVELDGELVSLADPEAAAQAVRVLQGVLTNGTATAAKDYGVTGSAGGKTGTTDDYRDAWFVGFTPELVVAVWVGRDVGQLGLSGSRAALPTWARFIEASGTQSAPFGAPDQLIAVELCSETGLVAHPDCPRTHTDLFVKGTVPRKSCDLHGTPRVRPARVLGGLFGKRDAE